MRAFKIENFERTQGARFPAFKALSPAECGIIRQRFVEKLRLSGTPDGLDLVRAVGSREGRALAGNAEDPGFDLRKQLALLGVEPPESVYLNWYRYDDIDQMRFADVATNLDDIWYPSSDDLDLFDEKLDWILSIDHGGHATLIDL